MNSKVLLILRIVFGLFLLFFGANKFYPMMEMVPPEASLGYWGGLTATGTMVVVAVIEIVAGLSLLLNKYASLMMLVLLSVSVNAVLYHMAYETATIGGSVVLLTLNIVMLYAYKDNYKGLFC